MNIRSLIVIICNSHLRSLLFSIVKSIVIVVNFLEHFFDRVSNELADFLVEGIEQIDDSDANEYDFGNGEPRVGLIKRLAAEDCSHCG